MSTCATGHLPPGALAPRRRRRWHTLIGQKGGLDRPQEREPAGVGLRSLLRRRHELSADAPSEEGDQRCFEARWRRGAGAASTPCSGRKAARIAPNSGSPRAWASEPSCGGCTRSQPTLPARRAPGGALRRGGARGQLSRPATLMASSFSQLAVKLEWQRTCRPRHSCGSSGDAVAYTHARTAHRPVCSRPAAT